MRTQNVQVAQAPQIAEVSGKLIQNIRQVVEEPQVLSILAKYELIDANPENWYSLQDYFNVLDEILRILGPNVLFSIGKHISKNENDIITAQSLENVLQNINDMHQKYHRGTEIGYFKLVGFSQSEKKARIECNNGYSNYLNRGIITALSTQHKPNDARYIHVEVENTYNPLDKNKTFYTIIWV